MTNRNGFTLLLLLLSISADAAIAAAPTARSSVATSRPIRQSAADDPASRFQDAISNDSEVSRLRAELASLSTPRSMKANAERIIETGKQMRARIGALAERESFDIPAASRMHRGSSGPSVRLPGTMATVKSATASMNFPASNPLYQVVESSELSTRISNGSGTETPAVDVSDNGPPASVMLQNFIMAGEHVDEDTENTKNFSGDEARVAILQLPGSPAKDGNKPLPVRVQVHFNLYSLFAFSSTAYPLVASYNNSTPYAGVALSVYGAPSAGGDATPICQVANLQIKNKMDGLVEQSRQQAIAECTIEAVPGSTIQVGAGIHAWAGTQWCLTSAGEIGTFNVKKVTAQFVQN